MEKERKYYVYIYLDPRKPKFKKNDLILDHEPIYVGCGYKGRFLNHLAYARNKDYNKGNMHKIYKIRQILEAGIEPIIIKYQINLTRKDALKLEEKLIEKIGRINDNNSGPLTNLVKGGEINPSFIGKNNPMYGKKWSAERKKSHSIKIKEYYKNLSEEKRKEKYGRKTSESHRQKMSQRFSGENNPRYGMEVSQETRLKLSESMKGKLVGEKNPNAKIWLVRDPQGNVFEVKSLHSFCRERGLSSDTLKQAGRRTLKFQRNCPSKGWSAKVKP